MSTITEHKPEIKTLVNGRVDELVKTAREAGYQHGLAEGINLERNRRGQPGGI